MKVGLVHNPSAGKSETSTEELMSLLRKSGYEPVHIPKNRKVLEAARTEGVGFVAIAGGDGTQRGAALQLVNSGVTIAPLPLGTANNIAKSFGVSGEPADIIPGWKAAQCRKIDVGLAKGPWGETLFLEGCGMGLIGRGISILEEIDEATSREFKDPEDKLHRDLSVFIALVQELSSVNIEVTIDGRPQKDQYLLVEVMNIRHAGPRIELVRRADPGDGFLDVVLATEKERDKLRRSLATCLAGSLPNPILDNIKARSVHLRMRPGEFRLDDKVVLEKHHFDPKFDSYIDVTMQVVPGALEVIVPSTTADTGT